MILKVSSKSNPSSVAGAIAGSIKEEDVSKIELHAIGAGAVAAAGATAGLRAALKRNKK